MMPIDPLRTQAAQYLDAYLGALCTALASVDQHQLNRAAASLDDAATRRASIFVCGNGGSAAVANHFAADHSKGSSEGNHRRPRVHSLCANMALFSALANDFGYSRVFESQLANLASPGDVLVVISSSGASPNILAALRWARANRVTSIAMTGFAGGDARTLADISIHVHCSDYGIVEDAHQSLMHILAQFLRRQQLRSAADPGRPHLWSGASRPAIAATAAPE